MVHTKAFAVVLSACLVAFLAFFLLVCLVRNDVCDDVFFGVDATFTLFTKRHVLDAALYAGMCVAFFLGGLGSAFVYWFAVPYVTRLVYDPPAEPETIHEAALAFYGLVTSLFPLLQATGNLNNVMFVTSWAAGSTIGHPVCYRIAVAIRSPDARPPPPPNVHPAKPRRGTRP